MVIVKTEENNLFTYGLYELKNHFIISSKSNFVL